MQPSDEIKQKLDIVDVIKGYLPLQQAGMNFKACCPFHKENSPSFMVSPDKQIYHCFGCGKGGDMFSFVMEIENVDFIEALRILAPKAGVTLKRQDPKLTSRRNKLMDIMDLSRRYYYKVLTEIDQAKSARNYLKNRGLSDTTIDEWQIGYSFDTWSNLCDFLKKKEFSDIEILDAGMSAKSQKSNRYYDRFRGRIMFPINDVNGNTIAFSARVSPEKEAEEKQGKYINSPQTFIYDKSKVLFGLDKAKVDIKKNDLAIIVEGQMDVIQAHQADFKNVVASSGTALTVDQLQLLKRYSNNIALAFDMDKAGQMAADRGILEAMRFDMNIRVIEVPDGKDPDECIKSNPDAWKKAVDSAKPVIQYYFDRELMGINIKDIDVVDKKCKYLSYWIRGEKSPIKRSFWIKELHERTGVSEEDIRKYVEGGEKDKNSNIDSVQQAEPIKNKVVSKEETLSELLLALVLKFPFLIEYLESHFDSEFLIGDLNKAIYKNLLIYYNSIVTENVDKEGYFDYEGFKTWIDSSNSQENKTQSINQLKILGKLVILGDEEFNEVSNDNAKLEMFGIVKPLKRANLVARIKEIQLRISNFEKEGNLDLVKEMMVDFNNLSLELRKLDLE